MSTIYQQIDAEVQLDAASIGSAWESITVTLGTEQDNGAASVVCPSLPGGSAESVPLYIYSDTILFNGEVAGIDWSNQARATLLGQDAFALLRYPWGYDLDRTYTDDDDASVIQNLVEAMGIDVSLTSIESSGWNIGVIQDVVLRKGDVPLELIRRIDEAAGYVTFSRSNGAVYRRPMELGTSAATFTRGDNIISSRRSRSRQNACNRCLVKGLSIAGIPVEGAFSAAAATGVIPDPPGYITREIYNQLIEDNTKALEVATAIVTRFNALQQRFELTSWLQPALQPGTTITIDDSTLGFTGDVYVTNLTHRITRASAQTDITAIWLPS